MTRARLASSLGDTLPPLGDGAAAVVVMRPHDVPAGRRVYATVDALALRRGAGSTARAASDSLRAAGLASSDVDYLELGGLTTASGNAEVAGLADVFAAGPDDAGCAVGRLGDLTGDVQRASVLAAVVKVALCLHRAEIPAAPAELVLDPDEVPAVGDSRLRVPAEPRPWLRRRNDRPRVAAISAVGHRGPDGWHAAHIVLSGADELGREVRVDWRGGGGALVLPLRADDGIGLAELAGRHLQRLRDGADPRELANAPAGALTAVLVAPDADRLVRELEIAQKDLAAVVTDGGEWATPSGSYCTGTPIGTDGRVAFVYPGAFTTYPGAGRDLFRLFPGLLADFEDHEEHPARRFKVDALYPSALRRLDRTALMRHETELIEDIPTVLATGTNLAVLNTQLLRDVLGLRPHGSFGYSLGESSMLFATHVWAESARDDAALTETPLFRGELCGRKEFLRRAWDLPDDTPDRAVWSTHVLLTSAQAAQEAMAGMDRVFLTHINTPGEVVIAGDPEQCAEVIARAGCRAARAPANHVMHCPLIHPVLDGLAALNRHPLGDPDLELELLSAYDYECVDPGDGDQLAEHIARTLCGAIDFVRLVNTAYDRGFRYFVEVGPGATCTRWIGRPWATGRTSPCRPTAGALPPASRSPPPWRGWSATACRSTSPRSPAGTAGKRRPG